MYYDPLISSRAKPLVSWGHDWVVLTMLVRCPWAPSKVWALPLTFRLYRNRQGLTKGQKQKQKHKPVAQQDPNHRPRPQLLVELMSLVAGWFPERQFVLSGDSAYGGHRVLSQLPPNVELISHVHPQGALYEPAPAVQPGQKGRRRQQGKRLPGMAAWARDPQSKWKKLQFDEFGLHTTLLVKTIRAWYDTAGGDRLLTSVLTRDAEGKRPDQIFDCTCLDWNARTILSHYAGRWAIEVTFQNSQQLLGLEDPAHRTEPAVRRTAPMAFVLDSLIVTWFHQTGHQHVKFPERPWYTQKREPSFADMLTTLRRKSWVDRFRGLLPKSGVLKKKFAEIAQFLALAG